MKRSDSTEMDRLLRRHARRGGESLRAGGDAGAEANSTAHLDADEMNAYAEGALPQMARSRYFAHLADCESCRKLVTELTLAANRAVEEKERVASLVPTPSKSWRERLAVIFSPAVLRYGVPALALFAVIVVAIVAMRNNKRESGVALNVEQSRYSPEGVVTNSSSAPSIDTTTTTSSQASNNAAPLAGAENKQTQPEVAATPATQANTGQMQDAAPVLSQERKPGSETVQVDDGKAGPGDFRVTPKREQPEVAATTTTTAPAAPPPAPKATDMASVEESEAGNRNRQDEQKKNKVGAREDRDEISVAGNAGGVIANQRAANEPRAGVGRTAASRAEPGEARKRPATAAKSSPAVSDAPTEKERSTETLSVGGRRFRKQGNAWVDTAYNSSRSTMNVARGSEQYRALVADEPALRTITERLGGEVIVVWKSRAYRFY